VHAVEQMLEQGRRQVAAANSGHGGCPASLALDAVEAAREPLLEPRGFAWIGSGGELLREQAQLARLQAVALPFQNRQLRGLQRDLFARGRAGDDTATGQRLTDEQWYTVRALLITSVRFEPVSSAI